MHQPARSANSSSLDILRQLMLAPQAHARAYDGSRSIAQASVPLADRSTLKLDVATWTVNITQGLSPQGGLELRVRFELTAGSAASAAVGVQFDIGEWSKDHYLFMPAAVYQGNRFRVIGSHRTPLPVTGTKPAEIYVSKNLPRLNIDDGDSRIQLWTSDLATPSVGFHSPTRNKALLVLLDDRTPVGMTGITIEESPDRRSAQLRIMAPGVRELQTYQGRPSRDRGVAWRVGDSVELRLVLHLFDATGVQALFDRFFDLRNELRPAPRVHHEIPFSSVWDTQHTKYNEQNWVEKYGYYSVGMRESPPQDWQTAWVGGLNTAYPLLAHGDDITQRRAARTFDFLFDGGVAPSGFLYGMFHEGQWSRPGRCYLRYSGDALYFLIKEFQLLVARHGPQAVPSTWRRLTRGLADAFTRTWERNGQFGHYTHALRDEIVVGGTCAASTAIGGLALASRFFSDSRYLDAALEAGRHYHQQYVLKGLTNAGPGDILQAPDSESCFGLLESFITLHDATQDPRWLQAARDVAHQCASWVTSYDFAFPPGSTFGKLDMLTTGTVWANVQNKHAAPGICTLSGLSLLKLFRASADVRYLDLIREIAHAIPQYMSRADRPIVDTRPGQRWPVMPPGWINERVNLSDWEVRGDPKEEIGVGEIFGGSTWSEPAMMLTYTELPGIYLQRDTRILAVLDHVEATLDSNQLRITNPTAFPARVKLLIETSAQAQQPLDALRMIDLPTIEVPPRQTRTLALDEDDKA